MLQSLFYLTSDLHVSGVTITHLQEHKTTVTTASGNRYTVTDKFTDKEYLLSLGTSAAISQSMKDFRLKFEFIYQSHARYNTFCSHVKERSQLPELRTSVILNNYHLQSGIPG
jgi:hypothetical protein